MRCVGFSDVKTQVSIMKDYRAKYATPPLCCRTKRCSIVIRLIVSLHSINNFYKEVFFFYYLCILSIYLYKLKKKIHLLCVMI